MELPGGPGYAGALIAACFVIVGDSWKQAAVQLLLDVIREIPRIKYGETTMVVHALSS